jgi:hypothetical protein
LQNQIESQNFLPEKSGVVGVVVAAMAICAILIFAVFVLGNWRHKALFLA